MNTFEQFSVFYCALDGLSEWNARNGEKNKNKIKVSFSYFFLLFFHVFRKRAQLATNYRIRSA